MYVDYGARRRRQTIHGKGLSSSSRLKLRGDLPSIEEAMKRITAALNVTEQVSMDVVEVQRLQTIIQGVEIYKDIFADHADYRNYTRLD